MAKKPSDYECPETLVLEIAKIVDPGAFSEWHDSSGNAVPLSVRTKYMRSKAEGIAIDIMERLSHLAPKEIRQILQEHERLGWKQLGIEGAAADKAIAEKHRQLQAGELHRPHLVL